MRKKAHFERKPRSVIVNVTPPVTHVAITERAYQDWKPVASQIISDVQTETPATTTRQHTHNPSAHPSAHPATRKAMPIGTHRFYKRLTLNGMPRVKTLKRYVGFHYGGAVETPKTNYDSEFMAYQHCQRQRII